MEERIEIELKLNSESENISIDFKDFTDIKTDKVMLLKEIQNMALEIIKKYKSL